MTTITHRQKTLVCAALSRAWRKAMADEQTWRHLDNSGKAQFIRSKIREEIYNLPEPTGWWGRMVLWVRAGK